MVVKIGVMDSGVGGLTVVEKLSCTIPDAQIIYYGDSGNCPYGNRSRTEIIQLAQKVIQFLQEKEVTFICIACNTISTVIKELEKSCSIPLLSIVEPVAHYLATSLKPESIGVIATMDTIQSKVYSQMIHAENSEVHVVGQGSATLADLIERGEFNGDMINHEIEEEMTKLLAQTALKEVVLGCTHYPIVLDHFEKCFPQITFINPAIYQAEAAKRQIHIIDSPKKNQLKPIIYTSGDVTTFEKIVTKLNISIQDQVKKQVM